MLFVDTGNQPSVTVSWTDSTGNEHTLKAARAYTAASGQTVLGENITCYAGIGGVRLTKGAGHPRGAIVRAAFYKADSAKPFFGGVRKDTTITVTMSGVRFNQPVEVDPRSVVQHLTYNLGEMQACGIPGDAREQFNLASPDGTLNDRVRPGVDARQGALDGSDDALGTCTLAVEEDGSVTLRASFRYPALRNLRDPWVSDLPGTFLEPEHFHFEFEALPAGTAPLPSVRED